MTTTTLIDPVCGMSVSESALRVEGYDDVAFCAEGCQRAFLADPSRYVDRRTSGVRHSDHATARSGGCRCGHHDASGAAAGADGVGHQGCGHHHGAP